MSVYVCGFVIKFAPSACPVVSSSRSVVESALDTSCARREGVTIMSCLVENRVELIGFAVEAMNFANVSVSFLPPIRYCITSVLLFFLFRVILTA